VGRGVPAHAIRRSSRDKGRRTAGARPRAPAASSPPAAEVSRHRLTLEHVESGAAQGKLGGKFTQGTVGQQKITPGTSTQDRSAAKLQLEQSDTLHREATSDDVYVFLSTGVKWTDVDQDFNNQREKAREHSLQHVVPVYEEKPRRQN